MIYMMVFKCLKAFARQVFNRLKNYFPLRFRHQILSQKAYFQRFIIQSLSFVNHIFQQASHWTKLGDFRLASSRGVTANNTVEPAFPNAPSMGSGSYQTSVCCLAIYMRPLGLLGVSPSFNIWVF